MFTAEFDANGGHLFTPSTAAHHTGCRDTTTQEQIQANERRSIMCPACGGNHFKGQCDAIKSQTEQGGVVQ